MQRTIRLETNREAVLTWAQNFFQPYEQGEAVEAQFVWRIVCEPDSKFHPASVPFSAFSDAGLRYLSIGQRGFIAVDLIRREAAAYFSDRFLEADPGFEHRPPLDALFCMTAPSLGLTTFSGGCVAREGRGVLVFGPANSGKTTACYLAARRGLEFHADQVIFLDLQDNNLRAWGDGLPAVFRRESITYLPELQATARQSTYDDLSFYYFNKRTLQPSSARPVGPVCSVFLDREGQHKELLPLARNDSIARLRDSFLFREDPQFEPQISEMLAAIAERPVYALSYPTDPQIAATVIEELLR